MAKVRRPLTEEELQKLADSQPKKEPTTATHKKVWLKGQYFWVTDEQFEALHTKGIKENKAYRVCTEVWGLTAYDPGYDLDVPDEEEEGELEEGSEVERVTAPKRKRGK